MREEGEGVGEKMREEEGRGGKQREEEEARGDDASLRRYGAVGVEGGGGGGCGMRLKRGEYIFNRETSCASSVQCDEWGLEGWGKGGLGGG